MKPEIKWWNRPTMAELEERLKEDNRLIWILFGLTLGFAAIAGFLAFLLRQVTR